MPSGTALCFGDDTHEMTILRTFAACTTILAVAMVAAHTRCRLRNLLRLVYHLDGRRVVRKQIIPGDPERDPSADQHPWRLALVARAKGSEGLRFSIAKSVTAQERLVDRNGRLRAFPDSYRDKKDIARYVAGHIHAGNAAFFGVWVNHHATFVVRLQPRILDKSDAWWHPVEKNKPARGRSGPLSNTIFVSSPFAPSRDRMGSERRGML